MRLGIAQRSLGLALRLNELPLLHERNRGLQRLTPINAGGLRAVRRRSGQPRQGQDAHECADAYCLIRPATLCLVDKVTEDTEETVLTQRNGETEDNESRSWKLLRSFSGSPFLRVTVPSIRSVTEAGRPRAQKSNRNPSCADRAVLHCVNTCPKSVALQFDAGLQ